MREAEERRLRPVMEAGFLPSETASSNMVLPVPMV